MTVAENTNVKVFHTEQITLKNSLQNGCERTLSASPFNNT